MAVRRHRRGFEPAGACAPDQLGLPKKRSRELRLAVAWYRVAGEVLASRARVVRVHRGTLEAEVDDPHWEEAVRALLPRLAGRLARGHPELGVRRCRLLVREGESTRRGEALELEAEVACRAGRPPASGPKHDAEKAPGWDEVDITRRVTRLAERYLSRADERGQNR